MEKAGPGGQKLLFETDRAADSYYLDGSNKPHSVGLGGCCFRRGGGGGGRFLDKR